MSAGSTALLASVLLVHGAAAQEAQSPASPEAGGVPWALRFAVIGDYGAAGETEAAVSDLVHAQLPEGIFTVGGNNLPDGDFATIDDNIGQYYSDFIHPYVGSYGPGATVNRFFPALGDRDWETAGATPYLDYFTLPGIERFYSVLIGNAEFFVLDSDANEPFGVDASSLQALWLQNALAASKALYRFVFLHHSPYGSSDVHGPQPLLQWPFHAWGATAVFSGHDHVYERLQRHGIPHLVIGVSGDPMLHGFQDTPVAGSQARFQHGHGALLVELDEETGRMSFLRADGLILDQHLIFANDAADGPEVFVPRGATWTYFDQGVSPGVDWMQPGFDASTWSVGPAELGYGDGDEATVVSFGPDPNDKYVTTYFRYTFSVTTPDDVTELYLDLLRDDGAVVYLNGAELLRSNMRSGPVTNETLAERTQTQPSEKSMYRSVLDPGLLLAGPNLLAVEIHQSEVTSSDKSFDLELWGRRNTLVLSPRGAEWRYLDQAQVPAGTWNQPGFDASAWPLGEAQFGYGDGDEATLILGAPLLNPGPHAVSTRNAITTYFRRTFDVADASLFDELDLLLLRDDAAVVYLNGAEVYRYGLPAGPVTASTRAGIDVPPAEESFFFGARIDHRLLQDGVNTLAVEIHQVARTSPDLSFDLELRARP